MLAELPLLATLGKELGELVAESFVPLSFAFGESVVREGDAPDGFYVLGSGLARVLRAGEGGEEVSLGVLRPGDAFGEEALLERGPRSATVRASSDVVVLRLDVTMFDALARLYPQVRAAFAAQAQARRLGDFLRLHSAFSELPASAVLVLREALEPLHVAAGELVCAPGAAADSMFLVEDGKLVTFEGEGDARRELRFLRTGEFFGELSLYRGTPRTAGVQALTDARLLRLGEAPFRRLLDQHPEFRARIEDRIAAYDRRQELLVPLDFADQRLPADASEAVDVERAEQDHGTGVVTSLGDPAAAAGPGGEVGGAAAGVRSRPRGRFGRTARFPLVRQLDEMDCGAAAVAMVCRHWGRAVSIATIRDAVGTSVDGTSLRGIQRGGEHVGLAVRALKASKDQLDWLPLPAIVHWGGNHWVVLYAVDGDTVRVADPARGRRRVDRAEFLREWSGHAALATATERLADAPLGKVDVRWLWPFVRPHRGVLALCFVMALAGAGLDMLSPVLSQQIVDNVLVQRDVGLLNILTAGMTVLLLLSLAIAMTQRRLLARTAVKIDGDTLAYLSGRMFRLPMAYFEARRLGDIAQRLDGVRDLRELLVASGLSAMTAVVQLVVAMVIMGIYSLSLLGLFVATFPVYAVLMRVSARRIRPTAQGLEEGFGRFRSRQLDGIRGIATVKSLGAEQGLERSLLEGFRELGERIYRSDFGLMVYDGVVRVTTFLVLTLFLYLGARQVMAGHLTLGEYLAFNALVLLANQPLGVLLSAWDQAQVGAVLLGRLQDIFDSPAEQADEERLRPVPTLAGQVTLRDVGFAYPTAPGSPILSDISLDVPPGTTVAIVGRSGSGKSTLVKCLAGLLEATQGSIAYDHVDLRELRYTELRRCIGYVLQDPYLFDDTIGRNIAYGEEHPDPDRVARAAEAADAQDFIERLPLGYDTRVGESGMRLSGGQAQRVSIARALYRRPPVLVFDEATSSLDAESERAVKQNLDRMLQGRTAFIVAHRLSTVREADLIIVLERGRLVERGTHEELMRRDGLYAYLVSQQLAA